MTDGPTNQLINQQQTDMRIHREIILAITKWWIKDLWIAIGPRSLSEHSGWKYQNWNVKLLFTFSMIDFRIWKLYVLTLELIKEFIDYVGYLVENVSTMYNSNWFYWNDDIGHWYWSTKKCVIFLWKLIALLNSDLDFSRIIEWNTKSEKTWRCELLLQRWRDLGCEYIRVWGDGEREVGYRDARVALFVKHPVTTCASKIFLTLLLLRILEQRNIKDNWHL